MGGLGTEGAGRRSLLLLLLLLVSLDLLCESAAARILFLEREPIATRGRVARGRRMLLLRRLLRRVHVEMQRAGTNIAARAGVRTAVLQVRMMQRRALLLLLTRVPWLLLRLLRRTHVAAIRPLRQSRGLQLAIHVLLVRGTQGLRHLLMWGKMRLRVRMLLLLLLLPLHRLCMLLARQMFLAHLVACAWATDAAVHRVALHDKLGEVGPMCRVRTATGTTDADDAASVAIAIGIICRREQLPIRGDPVVVRIATDVRSESPSRHAGEGSARGRARQSVRRRQAILMLLRLLMRRHAEPRVRLEGRTTSLLQRRTLLRMHRLLMHAHGRASLWLLWLLLLRLLLLWRESESRHLVQRGLLARS